MDYLYLEEYLINKKSQKNIQKVLKKIKRDIKTKIDKKRKIILNKYFNNYSKKNCKKFVNNKNKMSIYNLVFENINKFESQLKKWLSLEKNILIIGTQNHTKLIYKLFPDMTKLKVIGYVDYKKISKNKLNFLRNISYKKLYKENFDEIFVSTFEYNFDILEDLKYSKYKIYSMYDNKNRSLLDIYKKNIISIFKNYNLKKN